MQSVYGGRHRKLKKHKSATKTSLHVFYKLVAGDPGKIEADWRLWDVASVEAFPGTVQLEPAKTDIRMPPCNNYFLIY